ncbi:MAG: hypothetical protein BroJett026_24180 [Betaproteobacteria bacterium]|nr:MAG: hypothetical protein BroJett026_24180 [Betaproteobacteria bacterium]
MKHIVITLLAIAAAFALTGTASARHDDNPHGYSKQRAIAIAQAQAMKPVYLAVGPRAQDSPLRHVTVKSLRQPKTQVLTTPR